MKISMKMTERDRKLLMAVTPVFVMVIMVTGVIRPLHVTLKSMQRQMDNYEKQIAVMKEKTEGLDAMRALVWEKEESLSRLESELLPLMSSQKLDQLLAEKADKAGLMMLKLQISMPEAPAEIPAFGQEAGEKPGQNDQEGIYVADVKLDVSGTMAAMELFLDEISRQPGSVRVTALDWEAAGAISDSDKSGDTDQVMKMELEVYMCREITGQAQ